MPLPSCVGCVSTTSLRQPPLLLPTTHQLHLEASSTKVSSTVQPRTACLSSFLISTTSSSTIFVSTTGWCRPPLLASTTCWCQLLLISTSFGNTVRYWKYLRWVGVIDCRYLGDVGRLTVMRFGTVDPKITGGGNCGHVSTKSRLLMTRIGSSIVSCKFRTFDPANGWQQQRLSGCVHRFLTWRVCEGCVWGRLFQVWNLGRT